MASCGEAGGAPYPKTNHAQRVQAVTRLLAEGGCRRDVVAMARKNWGLSPRTADRLLVAARKELRLCWEMERRDFLAERLSAISDLQQRAMREGQLGVALQCINLTAKLVGLI